MTDTSIYITILDNKKRLVEWTELNQLKKDILWIFAENTNQLNAAFVPDYSFQSNYWEYLTLDGDKWFYGQDKNFYKQGTLIIVLCMTIEYIDTTGGNQKIFGQTKLGTVIKYVDQLQPISSDQQKLKEIVILGLNIATSMTEYDLINTDGYDHPELDKLYSQLNWVDNTFIKFYFRTLTE